MRNELHLRCRCRAALATAAAAVVAYSSSPASAGDAENGRRLAEQHCARCHVVGEVNRLGGIGSTPSFHLLVTALKDWRQRFSTFFARRPHPAFLAIEGIGRPREDLPTNAHPIVLPRSAVEDILAHAEALAAAAAAQPRPDPR